MLYLWVCEDGDVYAMAPDSIAARVNVNLYVRGPPRTLQMQTSIYQAK
jgi:hypothetical protein